MSLSELPARELARLDAVCLEYESRLRESQGDRSANGSDTESTGDATTDIDALVQRHGGEHSDLLRAELEAIRSEVSQATPPEALTEALDVSNATAAISDGAPPPAANTPIPDAALTENGLPPIGTEIGPYLLTSVLGRGGMGIVYRATDSRLDRSVAIKMLSVQGKQSDSLIERFQREAKAVAGLTHPHIVELFDVGVFGGLPYAVMEHLRGKTLAVYLKAAKSKSQQNQNGLPTEQIRRWGLQLAEALTIAHENGVIHRDLKPENVMVLDQPVQSRQGQSSQGSTSRGSIGAASDHGRGDGPNLKLFDFGLSRIGTTQWGDDRELTQLSDPPDSGQSEPLPTGQSMSELIASQKKNKISATPRDSSTRVGMILGTPGYMAPEQARGDVITTATDVFALGCVLYETMFGRPAFEGETPTKRFAAVLEKQPLPDPIRRRDDVELTDLILSMLAKDPAARPQAADVVETLRSQTQPTSSRTIGSGSSAGTRPTKSTGDVVVSRRRLIQIGVGGVASAIVGVSLLRGSSRGNLTSIQSIGVLSFQKAGVESEATAATPRPSGRQAFGSGELLSGLLVNELSRLEGFVVPKFVPMTASLPSDFQEAARLLEVDALVTGTYQVDSSTLPEKITSVNLEIISGETGKLIEGITVPTAASKNLIDQSVLAHNLAELIGRELTFGKETNKAKKNPEAFTCLIKGRIRSDPDSIAGMEMARDCFKHAISVDPNYAHAHAGLALTAITLAAQTSDAGVSELIAESQQSVGRALALDPNETDGLLARSMLDYQVLNDFEIADEQLSELTRLHPNHWQVQHQAGWLKMIRFEEAAGLQLLRRSTGLHPASRFLKADLARADWFRGYPDRAMQAALTLLKSEGDQSPSIHAKGLLIDLYEQSENYVAASEIDTKLKWKPGDDPSNYFAAREERLVDLPYGPFGETINAAILQIRRKDLTTREPAEQLLSRLLAAQLPMLPLVVCKHPALASMTILEQAVEAFPILKIG